ncbi:hypothetical protein Taro_028603 [Colocasia esculenta]|uniref:Uncharacterized protein n=1 Tax=Colocasia esculenta TaxID=4460 RepID=A0A843VHP4_COLES|nr:hypothetical protein [Colocasia esculenta]
MAVGHNSYCPLSRRGHRSKGFRLNPGRFSVLRLRFRYLSLIGLLSWCLESIRKGVHSCGGGSSRAGRRCGRSYSRRSFVYDVRRGCPQEFKLRPSGSSNTFYADAIADCLEFIKRTSVSVGEHPTTER